MAACSATGTELTSLEVQPTHSFLDHALLLLFLAAPGRPAFDPVELTPYQPPTWGTETQK